MVIKEIEIMGKYVLKRLGYMIIVFFILSFLMYGLYALTPSDRVEIETNKVYPTSGNINITESYLEQREKYQEELTKKLGMDKHWTVRYLGWLGLVPINGEYNGILQGNFGYCYDEAKPAVDVLIEPMKNTIFINIFATILALGVTIPLGIFCATHRGSKRDTAIQTATIIGYSIPTFIVAILFIWLFAGGLFRIFPASGSSSSVVGITYTGFRRLLDRLYYMALPLIVMTVSSLGGMTRYVRASMTEALSMDCIRTARAKGVREKVVVYSHAWRNALVPILTLVIGWFIGIFGGSVMIENIFGLNGVGKVYVNALNNRDFDVVMILQMFYVIIGLLGNLITDIVYGLADPRIRVNK